MSEQQEVQTAQTAIPPTVLSSTPEEEPSSSDTPTVESPAVSIPASVEPSSDSTPAKVESRLVPIELKGVNLFIELRVPAAAAESFEKTQSIVARLREKFGQDALIEELAQVVSGTIEKVVISVPQGTPAPAVSQPQQAQPVQVQIPQTQQDFGQYQIQSTSCPWTNQMLRNLDPLSIYKVLYESAQHRNLMTAQDLKMMEAYYAAWYAAQQQKTPPPTAQAVSFSDDELPF